MAQRTSSTNDQEGKTIDTVSALSVQVADVQKTAEKFNTKAMKPKQSLWQQFTGWLAKVLDGFLKLIGVRSAPSAPPSASQEVAPPAAPATQPAPEASTTTEANKGEVKATQQADKKTVVEKSQSMVGASEQFLAAATHLMETVTGKKSDPVTPAAHTAAANTKPAVPPKLSHERLAALSVRKTNQGPQ